MRDIGIEEQRLTLVQPLPCTRCLDFELAPETVNDNMTGRAMLGKLAARLEREQHQTQRAPVDQAGLAMAMSGRMGLRVEGAREIGQIEGHRGSGQAHARMWAKTFFWWVQLGSLLFHGRDSTCNNAAYVY